MYPEEEYHSLKETYILLCQLIDPKKTPNIPKSIRDKANKCLKDYPIGKRHKALLEMMEFFNPR